MFNGSTYLLDRQVMAGRGDRIALSGPLGDCTYDQLHDRVWRIASALRDIGLQPEQRVLMFMADSPDFVTIYLAAMRMGAVPVPVSTMLHADGLSELLRDSRARLLAITPEFTAIAEEAVADAPELAGLIGSFPSDRQGSLPVHSFDVLATATPDDDVVYSTTPDSPAFWLYTSGTTGRPKGAMHRHGSIQVVCETYGSNVLGIRPDDRCLSAAKAFFAYGLGNSVLFPLAMGATAILEPARSTPDLMVERTQTNGATLFFAGPTFFAAMLRAGLPGDAMAGVRLAASAGEPLPANLYQRWRSHFGVEIIDGIGMTEMLHIFLSNRPGDVQPGTTGVAVPGYELRIVDDEGRPVAPGTPGTLLVRGESAATGYWARYAASRQVFQGDWLRTGDTYVQNDAGYYQCLGRTNDMLKAGGMWVSPATVEARLLAHDAVAQAIVVAGLDSDGLEKPVAYVILEAGRKATEDDLVKFCRDGLPSYMRPRRVVFVDAYPTTATGKIRRVELRTMASTALCDVNRGDGA